MSKTFTNHLYNYALLHFNHFKILKIMNHNILNSSLDLSSVAIFSDRMRDSRRSSPESLLSTVDFLDLADFLDLVCLTTPDVDGLTSIGTSFGFSDFFPADFSFFTAGGFFPGSFFGFFGCDGDS